MSQEVIAAIDFGTSKISAAAAIVNDNEFEILCIKKCPSRGIKKGMLVDIPECRNAVVGLLNKIETKTGEKIKNITIGISARKLKLKEINININIASNIIRKNDILSGLKEAEEEGYTIIDQIINNYSLDDRYSDKNLENIDEITGNYCKKLSMNVTSLLCENEEKNKYEKLFVGTGYNLMQIKSNILAGKQIFLEDTEYEGCSVLIDAGAGETDIAVFSKNNRPVFIGSVPLGGNNITNDILYGRDMSFEEAEKLKINVSPKCLYPENENLHETILGKKCSVSKKTVYEYIGGRIEEILNRIQIQLKKTSHEPTICSIILYGNALSYFKHLEEIAKDIFRQEVKVIKNTDLGMKNSENVTAIALVTEVCDRLTLEDEEEMSSENPYLSDTEKDEDTEKFETEKFETEKFESEKTEPESESEDKDELDIFSDRFIKNKVKEIKTDEFNEEYESYEEDEDEYEEDDNYDSYVLEDGNRKAKNAEANGLKIKGIETIKVETEDYDENEEYDEDDEEGENILNKFKNFFNKIF